MVVPAQFLAAAIAGATAAAAAAAVLRSRVDACALLHEVLQWLLLCGNKQGVVHLLLITILCVSVQSTSIVLWQ
jgi:hypothetical protein